MKVAIRLPGLEVMITPLFSRYLYTLYFVKERSDLVYNEKILTISAPPIHRKSERAFLLLLTAINATGIKTIHN